MTRHGTDFSPKRDKSMIRFGCPICKSVLNGEDRKAGTKIACPKCGQRLLVPSQQGQETQRATAQQEEGTKSVPASPTPLLHASAGGPAMNGTGLKRPKKTGKRAVLLSVVGGVVILLSCVAVPWIVLSSQRSGAKTGSVAENSAADGHLPGDASGGRKARDSNGDPKTGGSEPTGTKDLAEFSSLEILNDWCTRKAEDANSSLKDGNEVAYSKKLKDMDQVLSTHQGQLVCWELRVHSVNQSLIVSTTNGGTRTIPQLVLDSQIPIGKTFVLHNERESRGLQDTEYKWFICVEQPAPMETSSTYPFGGQIVAPVGLPEDPLREQLEIEIDQDHLGQAMRLTNRDSVQVTGEVESASVKKKSDWYFRGNEPNGTWDDAYIIVKLKNLKINWK